MKLVELAFLIVLSLMVVALAFYVASTLVAVPWI